MTEPRNTLNPRRAQITTHTWASRQPVSLHPGLSALKRQRVYTGRLRTAKIAPGSRVTADLGLVCAVLRGRGARPGDTPVQTA